MKLNEVFQDIPDEDLNDELESVRQRLHSLFMRRDMMINTVPTSRNFFDKLADINQTIEKLQHKAQKIFDEIQFQKYQAQNELKNLPDEYYKP